MAGMTSDGPWGAFAAFQHWESGWAGGGKREVVDAGRSKAQLYRGSLLAVEGTGLWAVTLTGGGWEEGSQPFWPGGRPHLSSPILAS